jgi:hypothetical protein
MFHDTVFSNRPIFREEHQMVIILSIPLGILFLAIGVLCVRSQYQAHALIFGLLGMLALFTGIGSAWSSYLLASKI